MLGPVDLDDWRDDDELCVLLVERPEIQLLRNNDEIVGLRGWSGADFALAHRFARGESLESNEIRRLAQCLGA